MKKHPPSNGKNAARDSNQNEFCIIWELVEYPFKLRAGDVFMFNERLCRVIRVNECSAVAIMNQPVRIFKTRFDKPVRFQPPPRLFRISPQSDVPILNRRAKR
jgi:hypothetical protein